MVDDALMYLDEQRYVGQEIEEVHDASLLTVKFVLNLSTIHANQKTPE